MVPQELLLHLLVVFEPAFWEAALHVLHHFLRVAYIVDQRVADRILYDDRSEIILRLCPFLRDITELARLSACRSLREH